MTFGNPLGLIGLLSLPVILSLHLLSEHQRRYVVSHLKLWEFLDVDARALRFHRLPLTWILFLDLLIGALLSLAWSQPRVAVALPSNSARQLVILMDVSSSMRAKDGPTTRLEEAKAQAVGLLDDLDQQDVVTVLAFGRQASLVADSRRDGLSGVIDRIQSVRAGETGYALREALALGQASLDKSLPADFFILTDGDFPEQNLRGFSSPISWLWIGRDVENQAIVTLNATPLSKDRYQIFARIVNFSGQVVTREANLEVDGRVVDQIPIQIPADSSVSHVWQIPVDPAKKPEGVTVSLQGSDSLPEDDAAYMGLQPGGSIRVALVTDQPATIQQAVQVVPQTEVKVFSPQDYLAGSLAEEQAPFDLLVFRNFLPETWPAGQVLVVDPPAQKGSLTAREPGAVSFSGLSAQTIPANTATQILNPDPLVEGIDFSGVRWSKAWTLASPPAGFTTLLQAGEVPLLLRGEHTSAASGVNHIVVLLADLSEGNFTKHPAFPILMANLVNAARQTPLPPGFNTGDAVPLPAPGSYRSVRVEAPGQAPVELGSNWPAAWKDTLEPGLYRFRVTHRDGEVSVFSSGANAGDASESDLRPRGWADSVSGKADSTATGSDQPENQIDLRPWLLGAAIVALLLEVAQAWRR